MANSASPPSPLLARALKSLGTLTGPETRTGRVFAKAERGLTRAVDRVTGSPSYLRVSGELLRRGAQLRGRRSALVARALQALRMPSSSEVEALRDMVRRLGDQVEALDSQLERVAREKEREARAAPESPSAATRGRR
ncbi:hypothetical protein P2318_24030 [Myxococcaceae bacterium GXIMD 01537]